MINIKGYENPLEVLKELFNLEHYGEPYEKDGWKIRESIGFYCGSLCRFILKDKVGVRDLEIEEILRKE